MPYSPSTQSGLSHPTSSQESVTQLSHLIGLIYDIAADEDVWPQLLQALTDYVVQTPSGHTMVLVEALAPHFARAHQMQQDLKQTEADSDALDQVINHLPLGVALVDSQGTVVHMNRALLSMLRGNVFMRLQAGRLVLQPVDALQQVLRPVFLDGQTGVPVRLGKVADPRSVLVWVTRLAKGRSQVGEGLAMVMVASRQQRALTEEGLRSLFDLTQAEARLVQHLSMGSSVEEASTAQGISVNTAKTQLKRVFSKMGVKRQSELIQAVYSSPLWLSSQTNDASAQGLAPLGVSYDNPAHTTHHLRLADGRTLAFFDRGDPHGTPLIFMHGLVGGRHLAPPDEEVLREQQIRLIVPDRPGYGESDNWQERSIADWPKDVAQLADHLDLQSFAVLGCWSGTSYALACAKFLKSRVSAVVLVGALPPFEQLADLPGHYAPMRSGLIVARYMPKILPLMHKTFTRGVRKNVHLYLTRALSQATESDRQPFANPCLRADFAAAILESASNGENFLSEMRLAANDWGFSLEGIDGPVAFWHGDADQFIPIEGAKRLAKFFQQAQFHTVPGAGHYLIYSHWNAILENFRLIAASHV